eukprot:1817874-Prymnesium_polylepis.2
MATLGYPRLISIENFKVPHFELVADILIWLCQRYDKNMEILDEIRTEQDRVVFLKSVAEQLLVKVRAPIPRQSVQKRSAAPLGASRVGVPGRFSPRERVSPQHRLTSTRTPSRR